jgi:hypothetical protein
LVTRKNSAKRYLLVALMTGTAKHLFVLLFTHSLAAALDQ